MADPILDLVDQALANRRKRETVPATAQVMAPGQPPPDEAAEAIGISEETGVPPAVVQGNMTLFSDQRERRRVQKTLEQAPTTAEWLLEQTNSAVARDDVDSLAAIEEAGTRFPPARFTGEPTAAERAVSRGAQRFFRSAQTAGTTAEATAVAGRLSMFEAAAGLPTTMARHEVAEALGLDPHGLNASMAFAFVQGDERQREFLIQRSRRRLIQRAGALSQISVDLERINAIPMSDTAAAFRDDFFAGGAQDIGAMASSIAADPVGFSAFIAETAVEFVPVLAGAAATTLVTGQPAAGIGVMAGGSFLLETGSGIDEFLNENGADLSTPEGALAAISDPELMLKAQEFGFTRGIIIAALDGLSGGVAGRTLAASPAGDLALQTVAQMTLGGSGEALAQVATVGEVDLREVAVEALAEVATLPLEVGGVAGRRFMGDSARAQRAGRTAETLAEIDEVVAESKLRERAPGKFRQFLERTGFAGQALSVSAEAFQTFYQAKDVPIADVLLDFGIDQEMFEEALASGGTVDLPATVYAEKIAGTEDAPFFHENATLDPDEMSLAEAAQFNEEVEEIMAEAREEAAAIAAGQRESRASDAQVQDAVRSQLRAAGRSPDVAERESAVWAAFFRSAGERYGEDPLDLARQFGIQIEGPQGTTARTRDSLDIALNTLRAAGGLAPAQTQRLGDFVRQEGGLEEDGGSVDIDTMSEAALKAGFITRDLDAPLADVLRAAIASDAAETPVFNTTEDEQANRQRLAELANELGRRGLDVTELSNDEIIAEISEQDGGQTLGQTFVSLEEVPDSAFNGDLEAGLEAVFLSDASADDASVALTSRGFTSDEVSALEEAGLATDGRMSRRQFGLWSDERGRRVTPRAQRPDVPPPLPRQDGGQVLDEAGGETLFQPSITLFDRQLPIEGTGKGANKIRVADIGKAMTEDHDATFGRQLFPETSEEDFATVLEAMSAEVAAQLERPNSGVGWYGKDVEQAITMTAQLFPSLLTDQGHRQLYLTFAGLFSNGLDPDSAWVISAEAFQAFIATGEIPVNRAEARAAIGLPEKKTSFKDRAGKKTTKLAGWGVRNQANEQQLGLLKFLVEREGSLEAGMAWLLARQNRNDINQLMTDSGFKAGRFTTVAERAGQDEFGWLAFGKKLGRYSLGLQGVDVDAGDIPIDLWFTRTYRRLTGRLMETPIGPQGVAGGPASDAERNVIFRMVGELSSEFGLSAGDTQAVLWFFEKRLWATQGIRTNEGTNSSGARKLLAQEGQAGVADDGARGDGPRDADQQSAAQPRLTGEDAQGVTLNQPAFAGSPFKFEKFLLDDSTIGTGEGAQAFGWGLYFSERKGVAEFYREVLSRRKRGMTIVLPGGREFVMETVGDFDAGFEATEDLLRQKGVDIDPDESQGTSASFDFLDAFEFLNDREMDFSVAISGLEKQREDQVESLEKTFGTPSQAATLRANYDKQISVLRKMSELGFRQGFADETGRLFTVSIPDNDELLNWDSGIETLSDEASDRLFVAVDREVARAIETGMSDLPKWRALQVLMEEGKNIAGQPQNITGAELYSILENIFRGVGDRADKMASLWLLEQAGIPGHRFLDGGSRASGDGTFNFVVYTDTRVNVLDFEQTDDGTGPRGSITFPEGGPESGDTIIRLFDGADLSTVLHETGHFFIEVLKQLSERADAPQAMIDDMQVIHGFLGSEPGRPFTVEEQEAWARGFEAYLLEGNAPSLELMDAFSRFKAWLTRIYKSVLALNVTLTDEVRDVMDRMLATDEEIAAAREVQALDPLFTDADQAKAAGMTPAEFGPYQRMAERSAEQAEKNLLERTMAKVRRERQKWFKEERKATLEEVTNEINTRREYRLIELLANQRWLAPDQPDPIPDMQMDRASLIDIYGEGILAEISRTRLGGKRALYTKDGVDPQQVADLFGFTSVDEMIRVLQNAPKRKDAIAQEVERRLLDRHGDPLNDGSIEEEALLAIHSEQQARTTAAEARTLAKRAGVEHRNITSKVFRQRARLMLGRMKVADAAKPASFLAAERKAARAAQKAFARVVSKGLDERVGARDDLREAFGHKQAQLLNHMLYLEAKKLEAEVNRGRERMRRYEKTSVRKKLSGPYIDQIDTLLENYDFRKVGKGQLERRQSLADFVDEMQAVGRGNELAIDDRLVRDARQVHFSQMTVDELRGLFDTIANIDHMGRFKQKLIDAAGKREFEDTINAVVGQIRANLGTGRNREAFDAPRQGRRERARELLVQLLNADTILREMDGRQALGPAQEAIKGPVDAGVAELREMERAAAAEMDRIFSVYSRRERGRFEVKREVEGVAEPISKADALSLALNWGNDGNRDAVLESTKLTREDVEVILGTLDQRDWTFVQESWDFVNSFWDQIASVEERVTGVRPEKVEGSPFVTEFGVMRGGYYPLKYDASKDARANDETLQDLLDMSSTGMFGKAATRRGFAKVRVGSGGRPVRFGLGVMQAHIQQVMQHIALGEAVANAARILSDQRVKDAFIGAGRLPDQNALEAWIKDVAVGEMAAQGAVNQVARSVRSGISVSAMSFNVWTTALQFTGIFQSMVVIGKGPVIKGMGRMIRTFSDPNSSVEEEVYSRSKIMRDRAISFNKDIRDALRDMRGGQRIPFTERRVNLVPRWVQNHGFFMIVKAQRFVDVATWMGAYEKGLAELDGDEGKAARFADRMVERAQGSGDLSNRAGVERGTISAGGRIVTQQSEFIKAFTTFMSYMMAKFNIAYERGQRLGANMTSPVEWASFITDMAFLFTVEAIFISLIRSEFDEDDDEVEVAQRIALETGYAMLGTIPLVRQVAGTIQGFGGGSSLSRGAETVGNAVVQVSQGEMDAALVKALNSTGGLILKYPSSQLNRALDAAFREAEGEDVSPIEYLMRVK